jgi:type IV secretory pathway VirB2 component (pilin)
MTQTTPQTDILTQIVVALLAPMFFATTEGNLAQARTAALETITAYRIQNHASLLAVAKIIAFGLTTLSSLSLSMDEDLTIPLILRLRANANALDRSADRNQRALEQSRTAAAPASQFDEATVLANVAEAKARAAAAQAQLRHPAPQAPAHQQATPAATPTTPEQQHRAMWANAMANVASELAADMARLPPAQRAEAKLRANALSTTANDLLCGTQFQRPQQLNRTAQR